MVWYKINVYIFCTLYLMKCAVRAVRYIYCIGTDLCERCLFEKHFSSLAVQSSAVQQTGRQQQAAEKSHCVPTVHE